MPTAQVTFISGNWADNYDTQTLTQMYQEITDYFTERVTLEVLEKYDKSLDD
jgi:hypothetical protein